MNTKQRIRRISLILAIGLSVVFFLTNDLPVGPAVLVAAIIAWLTWAALCVSKLL